MLLALAVPAVAVAAVTQVGTEGATVSERAVRLSPPIGDIVTVYDSGALDASTESNAVAAARQAGADFTIRESASIAMQRIVRGAAVVQQAPSTFSIPMGTTVFDDDVIGTLMGPDVSAAVSPTSLVMSRRTADLRGAEAGDVVTLRSAFGAEVDFSIGAVIDDEVTGGTELLITPEGADRLSLSRKSSVVMWGFDSRAAIDQALADNDLVSTRIRIRRSWDPFDPDSTLGMGQTKELLGEFAYRVNGNGSVTQEAAWQAANLPSGRRSVGIGQVLVEHRGDLAAIEAEPPAPFEPARIDRRRSVERGRDRRPPIDHHGFAFAIFDMTSSDVPDVARSPYLALLVDSPEAERATAGVDRRPALRHRRRRHPSVDRLFCIGGPLGRFMHRGRTLAHRIEAPRRVIELILVAPIFGRCISPGHGSTVVRPGQVRCDKATAWRTPTPQPPRRTPTR